MQVTRLVSIILTTYNRPELLSETIQSILSQTYSNFELIVVDNNSNYDFFGLIENFADCRIKAFQNINEGIIAVNRNYGIRQSVGEYLAFCDDDDLWVNNKLQVQIEFLNRENISDNFLLFHNTECFGTGITPFKTRKRNVSDVNDLIWCNQISYSTVLLNKSSQVVFNEDPVMVAVEDYYLWLNLIAKNVDFHFQENVLVNYRINSNSQLRLDSDLIHLKRALAILKTLINQRTEINFSGFFFTITNQLLKFGAKRISKFARR